MRIDILTLFPEMVDNALNESIIGRGREAGLIDIRCHHIRDYSPDKRRRTDDYPYGGGQGMVMQCEPLARCLEDVQEGKKVHTILMSPAGARFDQAKARELLAREHVILVCGHYEGVDRRFVDACIDEELVRLNSHITQFRAYLEAEEPIGRKMDFIIQEMNRECNTIGSKANDAELTNTVLLCKAEIEKLREQIQNVE